MDFHLAGRSWGVAGSYGSQGNLRSLPRYFRSLSYSSGKIKAFRAKPRQIGIYVDGNSYAPAFVIMSVTDNPPGEGAYIPEPKAGSDGTRMRPPRAK